MKNGLFRVDVVSTHSPKVNQNNRFLKMVKVNLMPCDKGG